ncbi:hypothetical protein [Candidatus Fukatsuia symbiotica]|nr:hypothetical protein [Candidatus Fukatsuia symbiotica]
MEIGNSGQQVANLNYLKSKAQSLSFMEIGNSGQQVANFLIIPGKI